jgi:hypothetical protein
MAGSRYRYEMNRRRNPLATNANIIAAEIPPRPHEPPLLLDVEAGGVGEPPPGTVTTTLGDVPLVLPDASLDVTVSVWLPVLKVGSVTLHAPLPFAVVVAINTPPS